MTRAIDEQKARDGKNWSLKQMQIFRKNLQFRYDQLFKAEKKDDVINFEELGVDALIVDEAHAYKNNFSYTKMRNVAGISGQSSQRAISSGSRTPTTKAQPAKIMPMCAISPPGPGWQRTRA